MPHELLGDVLRTGDASGRHRRRLSVVPVSIAAHAAAILALLIIPLVADVELPEPARPSARFFHVVTPVPRPVIVAARGPAAPVRGRVAPSEAPTSIVTETPGPEPSGPPGPPAIGVPAGGFGFEVADVGLTGVMVAPPAPPPPALRRPVPVGGQIREPKKIVDVAPIYPPVAIAARKEGVVILQATLDERGNVDRLTVLRSEPLLDQAAIDAVRRWRYTPTLLNGVPVPVLMTITVRFSLR
jgi:protein TonB